MNSLKIDVISLVLSWLQVWFYFSLNWICFPLIRHREYQRIPCASLNLTRTPLTPLPSSYLYNRTLRLNFLFTISIARATKFSVRMALKTLPSPWEFAQSNKRRVTQSWLFAWRLQANNHDCVIAIGTKARGTNVCLYWKKEFKRLIMRKF